VGVGLGAYVMFFRGAPATTAVTPDTTQRTVALADSARAADSATTRPMPPSSTTTSPAPRTPAPVRPTGPQGTLSLAGNIPAGARITADGRAITRIQKLDPGSHRLRVEAAGFQTYSTNVTIASAQTLVHSVALQAATAAPTEPTGGTPTAPAVNCSNPTFGMLNRNNACFDTRPAARSAAATTQPEGCSGVVSPATILVQVSATGDVVTASPRVSSNCADFTAVAVAYARDMAFSPATKNGQPVAAWMQLLIRPLPR